MIKSSALVAILFAAAPVLGRHEHHHKSQYAPMNSQQVAALNVKSIIPDTDNHNICSFIVDDTMYVLEPLIKDSDGGNYEVNILESNETGKIQFNICNALNLGDQDTDPCYASFACRRYANGTGYSLSGTNFKDDIQASV